MTLHFFQNAGMKMTSRVRHSKRPINIKKAHIHLAGTENAA